jgi:ribose transport system permease protein
MSGVAIGRIDARAVAVHYRNLALSWVVLVGLIVFGAMTIDGFWSMLNLRQNLVFASFLGIAAIGQTLCALIGGLDLSIAFVIGAANIGIVKLFNLGWPSAVAVLFVLAAAAGVGSLSGLISSRQRGQDLVVTLGVGTALLGAIQIAVSSSGNAGIAGGTIQGTVPNWIIKLTALDSAIGFAPSVVLWAVLAGVVMLLLRRTWLGRGLYAIGGNLTAAERVLIPRRWVWILVYAVSAVAAASAGILLLGFTGGGYAAVGNPYLFTTIAAVLIGGTSLVGGQGGYGLTVMGVLILTVLQTILSGYSLSYSAQEAIFGGLIIPMVALYARSPHPRTLV